MTELELVRWGTRFAEARTEAAYAVWQRERALAFNRIALVAAGAVWTACLVLLDVLGPPYGLLWSAGIVGVLLPIAGFGFVTTIRPSLHRWCVPMVALTNLTGGLGIVALINFLLDGGPAMNLGGVCIAIYFGSVVARMRPGLTTFVVTSYVLVELALLVYWEAIGLRERESTILDSFVVVIAWASGLAVNVVADVLARQSFRQERIIAAQEETIERERARNEALLKQELGHQVAARSRELGQMLAKVQASLVVDRLSPGDRFDTRYDVVRPLGCGGMGAVYEVERKTDGRRLALKIITGDVTGSHAVRFAREAEIGARLSHPNLVPIVDVGIWQGVPFLVMELALGGSLEDRRARFGDRGWALPILAQIASGLDALHEAGVVHRDLKPANVLFGEDGVAKICDFGIARAGETIDAHADTLAKPHGLTATGMLLGTPFYMAPEAARGARAIAAPADVFAFGILACELLTGRAPFATPAVFLALGAQPLPAPALDGEPLEEVIVRCLADDPSTRPPMREVREALEARARAA